MSRRLTVFRCLGMGILLVATPLPVFPQATRFSPPVAVVELQAGEGRGQVGGIEYPEGGSRTWPRDFCVDTYGNIWIMDIRNRRVLKFSPTGDLLLERGSGSDDMPIFLQTYHIAAAPDGQIVVGPVTGKHRYQMVVLDNDGNYLRHFLLPGERLGDVGISANGEILYKVDETLLAVDLEGTILYAVENGPIVKGQNVSPFSAAVLSPVDYREGTLRMYRSGPREGDETPVRLQSTEHGGEGKQPLFPDADGNVFVVTTIRPRNPSVRMVSLYGADGRHIADLPDCPKLTPGYRRNVIEGYATDAAGNFYQMEVTPPNDAQMAEAFTPGPTFLRIWKWERQ